jgi:Regulator of ribonuclease activity B
MKKIIASLLAFVAPLFGASAPQKAFKRETLEFAFAEMRKQTNWDLEGKLVWGFFFTCSTKPPLIEASKSLEKMGYRIVSIYLDDEKRDWWLHAEKIEVHSVDSLHARNQEFVKFAARMKLGTYDGWDVGPVPDERRANQPPEPTRPFGPRGSS